MQIPGSVDRGELEEQARDIYDDAARDNEAILATTRVLGHIHVIFNVRLLESHFPSGRWEEWRWKRLPKRPSIRRCYLHRRGARDDDCWESLAAKSRPILSTLVDNVTVSLEALGRPWRRYGGACRTEAVFRRPTIKRQSSPACRLSHGNSCKRFLPSPARQPARRLQMVKNRRAWWPNSLHSEDIKNDLPTIKKSAADKNID